MQLSTIFDVVEGSLYSVQYEGTQMHELESCFELWNDPVYLRQFFKSHKSDLQNEYWRGITIEDAIRKTREDASQLEEELLYLAENGEFNTQENLSSVFAPLTKNNIGDFEKDKAKPDSHPSWIRIYAIRVEKNLFVVTGGAIKLTHRMNQAVHLEKELEKLEFVRNYLMNEDNPHLEFIEIYK